MHAETFAPVPRAFDPTVASVKVRPAAAADTRACGRIMHDAFEGIAGAHGFPKDFPSRENATDLAAALIADPSAFGVVAERDGVVIGSNFLTEGDEVRGVGPITVDPLHQSAGVGRHLMLAVLQRAQNAASVRLAQDSFNTRSVALYASLGFDVKAPLLLLQGSPRGVLPADAVVRAMTGSDIPACTALCREAHGVAREHELRGALQHFAPMILERRGRIVGYATAPNFWLMNHGVAETPDDMADLLIGCAAASADPVSLLLPIMQAELFRWCLGAGMRVIKPMTLMARGRYQAPTLCWFPSVIY
jgi:GNAT superfamily N-acetyltransferase